MGKGNTIGIRTLAGGIVPSNPPDYLGTGTGHRTCQYRHSHSRICVEYAWPTWRRSCWGRLAPYGFNSFRAVLYSDPAGSDHCFCKAYPSADVSFWHRFWQCL